MKQFYKNRQLPPRRPKTALEKAQGELQVRGLPSTHEAALEFVVKGPPQSPPEESSTTHDAAVAYIPGPDDKPSYQYDDLNGSDSIRLFELYRGLESHPLRGRLVTFPLKDSPQYDALSYMWGDPTSTCAVEINDTFQLLLASNLSRALTCLRSAFGKMWLWVDAICIDQTDVRERNHQVALMGDIYERADKVRAWIDEDIDLDTPVFKMMRDTWRFVHPYWKKKLVNISRFISFYVGSPVFRPENPMPASEDAFWEPLTKLINNPYWSRLWIQQELMLNSKVIFHVRENRIEGEDFFSFYRFSSEMGRRWKVPGAPCIRWRHDNVKRINLINLLSSNQIINYQCSEPRDRIYGLLGLAFDTRVDGPVIDYTLPLTEVYAEVCRHHLSLYKRLTFLCIYGDSKLTSPAFPSWLLCPERGPLMLSGVGSALIDASPRITAQACVDGRKGSLSVMGIMNNVVLSQLTTSCLSVTPIRFWLEKMGLASQVLEADQQYLAAFDFMNLLRSLYKTSHQNQPSAARSMQILRGFLDLTCSKDAPSLSICDLMADPAGWGLSERQYQVASWIDNFGEGLLIELVNGTKGLAFLQDSSRSVQEGDKIWVLFGCGLPVILRQLPNAKFLMIGVCIIPGVMFGEACRGIEKDGRPSPEYTGREPATIEII